MRNYIGGVDITEDVYYKIAKGKTDEMFVACVQWFDLHDYNFACDLDFQHESEAEEVLNLLNYLVQTNQMHS